MKVLMAAAMVAALSASSSSSQYRIERDVLASGGNRATASGFILESTLGQPCIVGVSTGGGTECEHGFWHMDPVRGDVNGDLCVNVADLLMVRNNLGNSGSGIVPPAADVNSDAICNVADLLIVRNSLGTGPGCP